MAQIRWRSPHQYAIGNRCRLISRRGHVLKNFHLLADEIAHSHRANDAALDGEIVCLKPDGRSNFYKLLFRHDWPYFCAFDLFEVDGENLHDRPLVERKHRLREIMGSALHLEHVPRISGIGGRIYRTR